MECIFIFNFLLLNPFFLQDHKFYSHFNLSSLSVSFIRLVEFIDLFNILWLFLIKMVTLWRVITSWNFLLIPHYCVCCVFVFPVTGGLLSSRYQMYIQMHVWNRTSRLPDGTILWATGRAYRSMQGKKKKDKRHEMNHAINNQLILCLLSINYKL